MKPKKTNPLFDILNSINYSKENLFVDAEFEREYNPYIINKFVSGSMDTVFYAAEMSTRPHLTKTMQYDFYRHSIRPKKRFTKWIKSEHESDVELVASYFQCSKRIAKQYMEILSDDDMVSIRGKTSKGGRI